MNSKIHSVRSISIFRCWRNNSKKTTLIAIKRSVGLIASKHHSQLGSIIESFLAFARPGKPDPDRIDINNLLDRIIDEQSDVLESSDIVIHRRMAPDLHAVPADERHLRSVFLNIILNARDALQLKEEDRHILVATRNRPDRISILISNNGPALSPSAAAHLFEPFYSNKDGGTGLGLAIVSRLVELHHGQIDVTSQEGQGVSFTIELPTQLGPAKPRTELPSPHSADFPSPEDLT